MPVEPSVWMNPVLLKPMGDSFSQVILHGKVWRMVHARDYYQHAPFLRQEALKAYEALASGFDMVIMEGAGSIAEINLWGRDFTNLSMAHAVGARSLLVADIERSGVFASILGTLDLLPPEYRKLICTFAVNRFRGDRSLFADGVAMLEKRSGLSCLGYFRLNTIFNLMRRTRWHSLRPRTITTKELTSLSSDSHTSRTQRISGCCRMRFGWNGRPRSGIGS